MSIDIETAPLLLVAAIGASPPFITLGWAVWEYVHPLLIPQAEIDSLARDYIARYGDDAAYALDIDIDRAQRRCEIAEAGGYRRILQAVERMQESDGEHG